MKRMSYWPSTRVDIQPMTSPSWLPVTAPDTDDKGRGIWDCSSLSIRGARSLRNDRMLARTQSARSTTMPAGGPDGGSRPVALHHQALRPER